MTDRQLLAAVEAGDCETAQNLLSNSTKIRINRELRGKSKSGRTVLHFACERGDVEMIKLLIKNGADVFLLNRTRYLPPKDGVIVSCTIYPLDVASFFIENMEGDLTGRALISVCDAKNLPFARFLISKNCPIASGWGGPLRIACMSKNVEMVELLLQNGAQMSFGEYERPLHKCCTVDSQCLEVFRVLIKYGADVNENFRDLTPLMCLSQSYGYVKQVKDMIQLLLESGAEINKTNQTGRTCLHFAASKSNLDLVEFLCEHGANPQAKSNFGKTPADETSSEAVKKFLAEFTLIDGSIKPAKREKNLKLEDEGPKKRKSKEESCREKKREKREQKNEK